MGFAKGSPVGGFMPCLGEADEGVLCLGEPGIADICYFLAVLYFI